MDLDAQGIGEYRILPGCGYSFLNRLDGRVVKLAFSEPPDRDKTYDISRV